MGYLDNIRSASRACQAVVHEQKAKLAYAISGELGGSLMALGGIAVLTINIGIDKQVKLLSSQTCAVSPGGSAQQVHIKLRQLLANASP